ncbi:MAG TPA: sigma 54-interacting transcriptional regulator [Candidatus Sulfotelmatobacter sp.]|nr:sigma 54-interacting transcriptional regulator [Candidatus Sulfotelmatobacter sp.]
MAWAMRGNFYHFLKKRMADPRVSIFSARLGPAVWRRYAAAVILVVTALAVALLLRNAGLPHPFLSFSFAAIAIAFWWGGTGPGVAALLLSYLALGHFLVPVKILGSSSESFLVIYGIFGVAVSWFSSSHRRAERKLTEARDNLELRVAERTRELTNSNKALQDTHAELRHEKDRLKLLLDLNNSIVSNLELRDLLRDISACVRRVMQCDAVGVSLADAQTGELRLYALDFPGAQGFLKEGMLRPPASLAAAAFSKREPKTFIVGSIVDVEEKDFESEGLQSACWLPLISHTAVLGVLGLSRLEPVAFSEEDICFLMQVASQVAIAVENALAYGQIAALKDKLAQENLYLENEIRAEAKFEEIVGTSEALNRILKLTETVAPTDSTVLICGETGTGKELIARAIHDLSLRKGKTFVRLNCAALPAGLLESELFGHEKGAFTGALAQRIGRLELADGGTLFLDEVGEIPIELQPKLLRVLQEREFERLGSTRTIRTDVRLIAATNRDLAKMVEEQKFRADLFFRLNVFPVELPALRERAEDIPLLVRHFAEEFSRRMGRKVEAISSQTMNALRQYRWPGNIRELQNVIERSVILSSGASLKVPLSELRSRTISEASDVATQLKAARRMPVRSILAEVDRNQILCALKESGGRIGGLSGAAARLGLKRTTLITRMRKLGIDRDQVSQFKMDTSDASDTPDTSMVQNAHPALSSSK